MHHVDPRRVTKLNTMPDGDGPVVYWMSRDQRVKDNWALLYAQELAAQSNQQFLVVFCLVPTFLEATVRQFGFMLRGLEQVEKDLHALGIPFSVLPGDPSEEIVKYAKKMRAGAVVTDFDPLRIKRHWREKAAKELSCVLYEVDAHNIVPCRFASPKLEFGAYTLRPKVHKLLKEFLIPFPTVKKQSVSGISHAPVQWKKVWSSLEIDMDVPEVDWCDPGEKAAHATLRMFLRTGLNGYDVDRNDPVKNGQSNLSPYLHFGQISAQRVALEVKESGAPMKDRDAYLEELIVRRELSDNFCWYQPKYDTTDGFPAWAQKTHAEHKNDAREYTYSRHVFEQGKTHDPLWNAAQMQMIRTGKMHGYMRMYWAKKIFEWTKTAEEAMHVAIYLNDKYELDGRDPNGYAGISWSIGGVHDRAWFDRPIFGKIRYMNDKGCKSKFDVAAYIKKFS